MEDVEWTGQDGAEEDERALCGEDGLVEVEVEVGVVVLGGVDAKVGDARRASGAKCDLDAALEVGTLQDAGGAVVASSRLTTQPNFSMRTKSVSSPSA